MVNGYEQFTKKTIPKSTFREGNQKQQIKNQDKYEFNWVGNWK